EQRLEWVNVRVAGVGPLQKPAIRPRQRDLTGGVERACSGRRDVWFDSNSVDTLIYARGQLQPVDVIDGPAIVEEFGSTTVVFPGQCAHVDEHANLILTRARQR